MPLVKAKNASHERGYVIPGGRRYLVERGFGPTPEALGTAMISQVEMDSSDASTR